MNVECLPKKHGTDGLYILEPRDEDEQQEQQEGWEYELRRAELEIEQDSSDSEGDPDLDETLAYEMAQVGAADIAALLAQLTQANIDRNARDVAADGRAAAAAIARGQEDLVRIQVQKIEKCIGDDKPKLRRWIRDISAVHATHPGAAVAVAERTGRENLSDTIEAFLTDGANAPRVGITWPNLRDNIQTLLLGDAYGEVLRAEHRTIRQKAHESTTVYSERYLASAKSAYEEPWNQITNQALIALFAKGLIDGRRLRRRPSPSYMHYKNLGRTCWGLSSPYTLTISR